MSTEITGSALAALQSRDGGWGYRGGSTSWTEPTGLALLALRGCVGAEDCIVAASAWLLRQQRADGGWAPQADVDKSTWVTSLAVAGLAAGENAEAVSRGVKWLLAQSGQQAGTIDRFRGWLLGQPQDPAPPGWSWYPGTASWVTPTAMGVLALERVGGPSPSLVIRTRLKQSREFLLARQCAGGGWNHGGTRIRSDDSNPYAETTGMALLALECCTGELRQSLDKAEQLLKNPGSLDGENWLRMGLAKHGRHFKSRSALVSLPRHTTSLALQLMVANPRNVFLAESRS